MIWVGTFNGQSYDFIGKNPVVGISGVKGYFGTTDIANGVNISTPIPTVVSPNLVIFRDPQLAGEVRFFGTGLTVAPNAPLGGNLGTFPLFTGGTLTGLEFFFNDDLARTDIALLAPGLTAGERQNLEALRSTFSTDPTFLGLNGPPDAVISLPNVNAAQLSQAVAASYNAASELPLQTFFDQFQFNFTGNGLNNTLYGTFNNDDILVGLGGNDALEGGGGNDTLNGGEGLNTLAGGPGSDLYILGFGSNQVGDDVLNQTDIDTVSYAFAPAAVKVVIDPAIFEASTGPAANDSFLGIEAVIGSRFNDELVGRVTATADWDRLFGFDGNDFLRSGEGRDTLEGGAGFDFLDGGTGGGGLFDGEPVDSAVWQAGPSEVHFFLDQFNRLLVAAPGEGLDTVINVERFVFAGQAFGGNQLTLSNANLVVDDDQGRVLNGGGLVDVMFGRGGNDRLNLGAANDIGEGGSGNDSIFGGDDDDKIFGEVGDDSLEGGRGNDLLVGGPGNDRILGNENVDTARFEANFNSYLVSSLSDGTYRVVDLRNGSPDGTDILSGVEFVSFSDQTLTIQNAVTVPPPPPPPPPVDTSEHVAEFGQVTLTQAVTTVSLERRFDNPVVIAQGVTFNGVDPVIARITDVQSDRFSIRLQEPNYLDGNHGPETVSFFVVEEGQHTLADGTLIEAGSVSTGSLTGGDFTPVAFATDFEQTPAIFSQTQTFNGADFVKTRQAERRPEGVSFALEEEEAQNGGSHAVEEIGWVAIKKGIGTWDGNPYQIGSTSATDAFRAVSFAQDFEAAPKLITSLASFMGADTAALRHRNLTEAGFQVKVEEETSADAELAHARETIDFLAIEGSGQLQGLPVIAQYGQVTLTQQITTVSLDRSFDNPVVIAQGVTFNGSDPVIARITDVQSDQFSIRLQEPNALDGNHGLETVSFVVVEAGQYELPDGTVLAAGAFETGSLTTQGFVPVSFGDAFDATPAIFSQTQTFNGADFVKTRHTERDAAGVKIALEEEEAQNGGAHAVEKVGWLAIEKGIGDWDGNEYQIGSTSATQAFRNVNFAQDFDATPQLITSLASFAGSDTAALRHRSLTENGFQVKVEEDTSADAEIVHARETIDFMAMEGSGFLRGANPIIAEAGRVDVASANQVVTLSHRFDDPIVFALPAQSNGPDPVIPRIIDVQDDRFTLRLQEPNNIDGNHGTETVSWLAVERGTWVIDGGTRLEVGSLTSSKLSSQGFETVSFDNDFDSTPTILSQTQTFNGTDFVVTRQKSATPTGVEITMQEEQALNGGGHATETIGWLAIDRDVGVWDEMVFQAGTTGNVVTDATHRETFTATDMTAPVFLASLASFAGADSAWLRYDNLTPNGVDLSVEEDTSFDAETSHGAERADYLVLGGVGLLTGQDADLF